jgi:hypothetical protein
MFFRTAAMRAKCVNTTIVVVVVMMMMMLMMLMMMLMMMLLLMMALLMLRMLLMMMKLLMVMMLWHKSGTTPWTALTSCHQRPLQPYRVQVSGCCSDGGESGMRSVSMVAKVMFEGAGVGEGQQPQQPCIVALPWFLPIAPFLSIPLPPNCTAAFASSDSPGSSSQGFIVGSRLRHSISASGGTRSAIIEFDADVEVGE